MAKKLDKNQIAAAGSIIVVGAKVVHEVWEALNKDGRVSDGLKSLGGSLRGTATVRSPQARLLKQLEQIDQYALKAAEHPASADRATGWLQDASAIRAKLPLVDALPGKAGKQRLKDLQQRTSDLLTDIITSDLAPDSPVDPLV